MKKTLVALAAVAVTGGAFAQATMTGAIAYGFSSQTSSSNVTTSGMGVDDAEINFAISEDLDGGNKLSGGFGFGGGGKAAAVTANDWNLTLTGASGAKLVMKTTQAAEYLSGGIAGAGANYEIDLTYTGLLTRPYNDAVSVSFPVFEGATLTVTHTEPDYAIGGGSAANIGVLATTTTSAGTMQRYNTAALTYKAGALVVDGQYRSYDDQQTLNTVYANTKNRFSASYDMGVAKIGAGIDTTVYTYGNSNTKTLVGMTVPMGQMNLGAQLLTVTASGNATSSSNYTRTATLIGGQYNVTKRTYATAQYYTGDVGGTSNINGYVISLYNTF